MENLLRLTHNVLHCRRAGNQSWSSPVKMLKRKMNIKLPKSSLERVQPQTKADSELQPKLVCPALTFGNALLAAGRIFRLNLFNERKV